ncbi:hypothetical protein POTOM_008054 [Populus tomentosa]|uniref:Uncharacterized protein n=1 Tax=Populus tomentosa TaxID=118781 RepID=A0A8X8AGS4_POPTO|nr:hypothetical protein POTOM_008054 [Populus tomentosa]
MGLSCFACFDGGSKQQRREEERLASAEARAKAAEAAQKRQEQFEKSAAGRAACAQLQGMAKQSANSNKGEPVLKVSSLKRLLFSWLVVLNGMADELKLKPALNAAAVLIVNGILFSWHASFIYTNISYGQFMKTSLRIDGVV